MYEFLRRLLGSTPVPDEAELTRRRQRMVLEQLVGRGIEDGRVLQALGELERHRFVPAEQIGRAYRDGPLPIGHGQTISQPYIVAFMTEALELRGHERVLEIGTGSGYQAAVLARLAAEVFSIEVVAPVAEQARRRLEATGVRLRVGDGRGGWPEEAPFDRILVTAAPPRLPHKLLEQLTPEGRLIAPVGTVEQQLCEWRPSPTALDSPGSPAPSNDGPSNGGGFEVRELMPVRFVPLTGADA